MPTLLIPVDGSDNSTRAVDAACAQVVDPRQVTVHLLNVQAPNHSDVVKKYLNQDLIDQFHQEEGKTALRAAQSRLDEAHIPYTAHIEVGDVALTIARCVKELRCDQVIMGTRGLGTGGMAAISGLLMGSIATKVLHLVDVPVTFVK